MSPWRLRQIAKQINRGALIAYPTDTIWGFGCHPESSKTIQRLLTLKKRSQNKGMILLSPCLEYLKPYIEKKTADKLSTKKILGRNKPVTWLIKASSTCPSWLTGNFDTVAIRITNKKVVKFLCHNMQSAIISTSANLSGLNTARNSFQVHKHFQRSVDYIIEGFETDSQQASEIRILETGKIIRP